MPTTLLSTQPLKSAYLIFALTETLLQLPYHLLSALVPQLRPHPKWTYRQTISTYLLSRIIQHVSRIQLATPLPLHPGAETHRFATLPPAHDATYAGPLRAQPNVVPQDIGATWYPAPLSAAGDTANVKVVLHLHGGAFVHGDGRTQGTGFAASTLLDKTDATHVLAPQYRLSKLTSDKENGNPFPAALQDAVTAYAYLVRGLGVRAERVVVSGDSAGGNLVAALLRYLSVYGGEVGLEEPGAALLWSPWVDPVGVTRETLYGSVNFATDYLCHEFTEWGVEAYEAVEHGQGEWAEYVCVSRGSFRTGVPIWVNAGGAEVLLKDDGEWVEMMRKEGNHVTFDVTEAAPHDIVLVGDVIGFRKEAEDQAHRAGEWLREVGW